MATPTAFEQYMLELVNQARADPGAAAEKYGFSLGNIPDSALEPLAMNEDLLEAARGHSEWMENTDTFSHTGAGGSNPTQRADAAGWDGGGVGENIAGWFSSGSNVNEQDVVEERHGALLRSPGHLANIMNENWSEAGIGGATGDWEQFSNAFLYTQAFSDDGQSFLTGVAFDDNDGDNFYDVGEGLGGVDIEIIDSEGNSVDTSTWEAGGYQIALEDGDYTVRFSGEGINGVVEKQVTIAGGNVKVDINTDLESPVVADNDDTPGEDPTTEDPDMEEPTAEDPDAEDPDTDEPTAEDPDAEEPTAEDPDTDEPTVEDPDAEEPTAEDPDTDEPTAEDPDAEEPTAEDPDAEEPTAEDPDTEEPDLAAGPAVSTGTEGDDVFMDMENDQIILGAAGNDRFETESSFDDYNFMLLPNNGVLLLGADSTKVLFDVETIEFADLSIEFKAEETIDEPDEDDGMSDPSAEVPTAEMPGDETPVAEDAVVDSSTGGNCFNDDLMVA
ncbi:CAP domain-containing protein [Denitrobaculum tricleocarpae]|uniref:SCP domain-containing protein n=1 Tax=Denitrobaculum tricleocarpae TaxID=2591009 RepID=A0A545TY22_9PROT|nr:CAP domain-containing protein [Denitrobaculum tricleocarpae]TQV82109.1 hypothetical protein FKG95_07750 [Denitrobaculum tricleocarpae]